MHYSQVVETARNYYNSTDADNFYATIWGGEDIHIGIYEQPEDTILTASRRTVERIAAHLTLDQDSHVLDMGAGYGGAARYLTSEFGCRVDCLNLSEVQNSRNRSLNQAAGMDNKIQVIDGSFEEVPADSNQYHIVWSQDSFLHSNHRHRVLAEAERVLKPGGELIFTDPMQSPDCPQEVLKPIFERIHLSSLGSIPFYEQAARELGMETLRVIDLTPQLATHYGRVLAEINDRYNELVQACGADYLERMKAGLGHWIDGGEKGHLSWGILHFYKPPK